MQGEGGFGDRGRRRKMGRAGAFPPSPPLSPSLLHSLPMTAVCSCGRPSERDGVSETGCTGPRGARNAPAVARPARRARAHEPPLRPSSVAGGRAGGGEPRGKGGGGGDLHRPIERGALSLRVPRAPAGGRGPVSGASMLTMRNRLISLSYGPFPRRQFRPGDAERSAPSTGRCSDERRQGRQDRRLAVRPAQARGPALGTAARRMEGP